MKKSLMFILAFFFSLIINAQNKTFDISKTKGPYFGQKPPGMTPELFAPGFLSTNLTEYAPTFTKDGLECYFSFQGLNNLNHILTSRFVDGEWTKPEFAVFTNFHHNADPYLSPDGKRLFFWSNRPPSPNAKPGNNSDIWYVEKTNDGWGEPVRLDSSINTNDWQIYPTVALNGNLYFSSNYKNGKGDFDIYMCHYINGKYSSPVNLGDSLNTSFIEQEPFIAPDESYIIFCSDRQVPKSNRWDLYISFKLSDGKWSKAVSMGNEINSPAMDQTPLVTSDGKYLYFSSSRTGTIDYSTADLNFKKLTGILNSPQNGSSDIYWVDAKIIETIKNKITDRSKNE